MKIRFCQRGKKGNFILELVVSGCKNKGQANMGTES